MPKLKGTCKQCGTDIEFWPSQPREYCSRKCMGLAHKGREMPTKPRTGRYVPCEVCSKDFWRRPHQERNGGGRFCSKACMDKWQKRTRVEQTCPQCGKTWMLKVSQKYYGVTYCSRACEARSRMKRPLDREHNGKPAVIDEQGYVRIFQPDHPRATKGGWIFEHRWVIEQQLGRHLERDEHVHHLNHIRSDNRLENLQLLSALEHMSITGRENGEALKAAIAARQRIAELEKQIAELTGRPLE